MGEYSKKAMLFKTNEMARKCETMTHVPIININWIINNLAPLIRLLNECQEEFDYLHHWIDTVVPDSNEGFMIDTTGE